MRITESSLRNLIREVLEEYNPTEQEIIDRTVDNYFSDSNRRDLVVNQDTRNRDESAYEFASRVAGSDLSNEILNRLSDAGKYENTRDMTKYEVLTLQKLSERHLELGVS